MPHSPPLSRNAQPRRSQHSAEDMEDSFVTQAPESDEDGRGNKLAAFRAPSSPERTRLPGINALFDLMHPPRSPAHSTASMPPTPTDLEPPSFPDVQPPSRIAPTPILGHHRSTSNGTSTSQFKQPFPPAPGPRFRAESVTVFGVPPPTQRPPPPPPQHPSRTPWYSEAEVHAAKQNPQSRRTSAPEGPEHSRAMEVMIAQQQQLAARQAHVQLHASTHGGRMSPPAPVGPSFHNPFQQQLSGLSAHRLPVVPVAQPLGHPGHAHQQPERSHHPLRVQEQSVSPPPVGSSPRLRRKSIMQPPTGAAAVPLGPVAPVASQPSAAHRGLTIDTRLTQSQAPPPAPTAGQPAQQPRALLQRQAQFRPIQPRSAPGPQPPVVSSAATNTFVPPPAPSSVLAPAVMSMIASVVPSHVSPIKAEPITSHISPTKPEPRAPTQISPPRAQYTRRQPLPGEGKFALQDVQRGRLQQQQRLRQQQLQQQQIQQQQQLQQQEQFRQQQLQLRQKEEDEKHRLRQQLEQQQEQLRLQQEQLEQLRTQQQQYILQQQLQLQRQQQSPQPDSVMDAAGALARSLRACKECRRRKIKCDTLPGTLGCTRCERLGIVCQGQPIARRASRGLSLTTSGSRDSASLSSPVEIDSPSVSPGPVRSGSFKFRKRADSNPYAGSRHSPTLGMGSSVLHRPRLAHTRSISSSNATVGVAASISTRARSNTDSRVPSSYTSMQPRSPVAAHIRHISQVPTGLPSPPSQPGPAHSEP